MNPDQIYAEMNQRIEKRLKGDPGLAALQKRQLDLGKRMQNAAVAGQKRIEGIVAEEFKKTFKLIRSG